MPALPITILAALGMLLMAISPVGAAPTGSSGSRASTTDHVECNVFFEEGTGALTSTVLTPEELDAVVAFLEAEANAELAAVVDAASLAGGCLLVTVDGEAVLIDAHFTSCNVAVVDGNLVIGESVVATGLAGTELAALVAAVAAAQVGVCADVTLMDNVLAVTVTLDAACVEVRVDNANRVTITLGGEEFVLDLDAIVDAEGVLEAGFDGEVGLAIVADVNLTTGMLELTATVTDACPGASTITVDKVVTGTGASTTEAFDIRVGDVELDLSAAGEPVVIEVEAGVEFTVSETLTSAQLAAGWTMTGIVCTSPMLSAPFGPIDIVLGEGQTVTCVVTNNFVASVPPVDDDDDQVLPDTAVAERGGTASAAPVALAVMMLASLGVLGYTRYATRRV